MGGGGQDEEVGGGGGGCLDNSGERRMPDEQTWMCQESRLRSIEIQTHKRFKRTLIY